MKGVYEFFRKINISLPQALTHVELALIVCCVTFGLLRMPPWKWHENPAHVAIRLHVQGY